MMLQRYGLHLFYRDATRVILARGGQNSLHTLAAQPSVPCAGNSVYRVAG